MSQILRWVGHPDLSPLEQLLVHIGNLRTPTAEQLAALMGRTKEYTVTMISRLNKKGEMVRSMKLKGLSSPKVYYLGRQGVQMVEDLTGIKYEYHEFSRKGGQSRHTKGINDILIRMIQQEGLDDIKRYCQWWNSRGAKQVIMDQWSQMEGWGADQLMEESKTFLSPDARFATPGFESWIEFDNDTKDENLIRGQCQLYILKLVPVENHDPVVWVAKTPRRRDELKRWWEKYRTNIPITPPMRQMLDLLDARGKQFYVPDMYFFAQGEETTPLVTGNLG
jgi:hypothetical protein